MRKRKSNKIIPIGSSLTVGQPTFNEVWENGRAYDFISMEPATLVDANELREEYLFEEPGGWKATKRINGLYDSRYVEKVLNSLQEFRKSAENVV